MKKRWLKGSLIGLGALVLSTLGIFASDSLRGIDSRVDNLANLSRTGLCAEFAVPVKVDGYTICVDKYEASPSERCSYKELTNAVHSQRNSTEDECFAVSKPDSKPWNYISLNQAQSMCAKSGKRLPTSNEWYAYALGTESDSCVIESESPSDTGNSQCVSSVGAEDVVGNLWEWVDESVSGGTLNGVKLPEEGYVSSVDADGVAITSTSSPDELYDEDYFWSKPEGVFGMVRGGFYGSGSDGGIYTINTSVQTSLATLGIGFRCVEDVF